MSFNLPAQGTIALIVVTALITGIVAVFGRRAAEALLDWFLLPFKWLLERIYRWVAPRNPFPISLRNYKRRIKRSWLTKIENPIGPELDVPLEHAFAPLKLISSSSQETIDLFAHVSTHARCVLLGGPGTGKTTLMKSLVTSVIHGRANETLNALIPVFVVLRKLATKQQSVKEAIVAAFADFHFPGADKFVDSVLREGRMLIVLDGLDEVGVNREYVVGEIISFCQFDELLDNHNHVVVTCREYSYRTEDLRSVIKNVVRVEPFANHHMRVFLQGWPSYQGRSALALYGLIQGDSQIRDICRNPLLLTILTGLYLETKHFEFPTSRSRFYNEAIDELIIKRPARRGIKQKFESTDKLSVLQRVSLTRLETVQVSEDPEELTADAFREQATAVFRKEVDFNEFIKELVEINGIIKPTSDGIYTCAHRTIQEYFAANEAGRVRESQDVVQRFSNRQDLIEVLYFYCGMLRNIPELTKIIDSFIRNKRWLEAARCLLSMTEVPVASQVSLVTTELKAQILRGTEFRPVLEILSSLAQRPEAEFDVARQRFFEAVNHLAVGNQAIGASALESALATSPDAAMRVIPGLLKHDSERWQIAAVRLLKDIATEESLDRLVQLLSSDNTFVRKEASKALAGLVTSRNKDLKDRAGLLPDRQDSRIWPLETVFPGRIAIPIAESLINEPETGNAALDCATKAMRLINKAQRKLERRFLRQWRNVSRDLRLRLLRAKVGTYAFRGALVVSVSLFIASILIEAWCYKNDKTVLCEIYPINVHVVDRRFLRDVEEKATDILVELNDKFPPPSNNAVFARILPKNIFFPVFSGQPAVPEMHLEGVQILRRHASDLIDPYDLPSSDPKLQGIAQLVSKEKFDMFDKSTESLKRALPVLNSKTYMVFQVHKLSLLIAVILPVFVFIGRQMSTTVQSRTVSYRRWGHVVLKILVALFKILCYALLVDSLIVIFPRGGGMGPIRLIVGFTLAACLVLGALMQRLPWPRNPLLATLNDLVPLQDRDNKAQPRRYWWWNRLRAMAQPVETKD